MFRQFSSSSSSLHLRGPAGSSACRALFYAGLRGLTPHCAVFLLARVFVEARPFRQPADQTDDVRICLTPFARELRRHPHNASDQKNILGNCSGQLCCKLLQEVSRASYCCCPPHPALVPTTMLLMLGATYRTPEFAATAAAPPSTRSTAQDSIASHSKAQHRTTTYDGLGVSVPGCLPAFSSEHAAYLRKRLREYPTLERRLHTNHGCLPPPDLRCPSSSSTPMKKHMQRSAVPWTAPATATRTRTTLMTCRTGS